MPRSSQPKRAPSTRSAGATTDGGALLASLDDSTVALIGAIRTIILNVDPRIREEV